MFRPVSAAALLLALLVPLAAQSRIAIAATLYQFAMRDEMLPRPPAAQMPPQPTPARP